MSAENSSMKIHQGSGMDKQALKMLNPCLNKKHKGMVVAEIIDRGYLFSIFKTTKWCEVCGSLLYIFERSDAQARCISVFSDNTLEWNLY